MKQTRKTQLRSFEAARPLPAFCHSFITRDRGSDPNAGLTVCRLLGVTSVSENGSATRWSAAGMVPLRAKALRSSCLNWLSQPLFNGVNDAPMIPGSEHRLDVFWR